MKRLFGMAILLTALCSTLYAQSPDTPSFKLLGHQDALRLQKDSLAHRYAAPDSGRLVYTPKQLIVPGLLAAAGMATFFNKKEGLKNELVEYRTNHFSSFRTKVDNYMQFSPLIANYVLEGLGVPGKTDPANQAVIMFKSEALMLGATYLLKNTIHETRPDGSNNQSFPSGHTAQAFMAATILSQQYGYRYKWMPYAAYSVAAGTGVLRMANNKHYICDVLVGAAIGILSVKVAYWTHAYKWGKHKKAALSATFQP